MLLSNCKWAEPHDLCLSHTADWIASLLICYILSEAYRLSVSSLQLNGTLDFSSGILDDMRETSATQSMQGVQDRLKHMRAGSPFRYSKNSNMALSSADVSKLSSSHGVSYQTAIVGSSTVVTVITDFCTFSLEY